MADHNPAHSGPLLLATRSADKAREIRVILQDVLTRKLVTLQDIGLPAEADEDAVEVHETFLTNALAKARFFRDRTGLDVLADDSGIAVDALHGAPGVRSRRFSGTHLTGGALDQANNAFLLRRLQGIDGSARSAHYVCAAVLLGDRAPTASIGCVNGSIAPAPAGDNGFGYDPLFLLPEIGVTFAQLSLHEKNRHSHRARAFRALAAICSYHFRD